MVLESENGKGEAEEELMGSRLKKTASSGRPCGRRIGRRHPAAVDGEEGSRRRLGVLRPCVGRRRGARVLGGARGLVREARGRRWPRQQQAAAAVALGCVREKEQRRRWGRGSEREGSRGSRRRREDDARRRGVQAMQTSRVVAWRARARAPSLSSAYWREEEGDKEEEVGWAGQMELGQVSGAR